MGSDVLAWLGPEANGFGLALAWLGPSHGLRREKFGSV
jgi:hypothetical protein